MIEMTVWQAFAMVSVGPFVIVFVFLWIVNLLRNLIVYVRKSKAMPTIRKILQTIICLILVPIVFSGLVITQAFFIAHVVKAAQILTAYMMG